MRGFTLIEILVSVLILGLLFAGIYGVLSVGNIIFREDMGLVELQQQARQGMYWMVKDIRQTEYLHITLNSSSDISFSIPAETYGDWLGPIRYYLDSGTDQIKREYAGAPTKILANDITVLNFSMTGDFITGDVVVEIELAAKKKKTAQGRELCFPAPCPEPLKPPKTLKEIVKLRN